MYQYLVLVVLFAQWVLYLNWNHVIKRRKHKEFYGRNKSYIIGFFLFFGICYCYLLSIGHIDSSISQVPKLVGGILMKVCFLVSLMTLFAHLFLDTNAKDTKFIKQDVLIDTSSVFMLFGLIIFGY